MGRLDFKRGRFNVSYETTLIHDGLRGRQNEVGESVQWYRYDEVTSQVDDLFDEGAGVGKVYRGPFRVPVLHVMHLQSPSMAAGLGLYTSDDLTLTASYDQMMRFLGLNDSVDDLGNDEFLRDRIVYDHGVFRITSVAILGQIRERDVIVSVDAAQVKDDELVNDEQFAAYAR